MLRLAHRLGAALNGAPDDEELRGELVRIDDMLRIETHRGVRTRLQKDRELITRRLAFSARLDDVTGLPWEYLARYRWLPDRVLGQVPAFLGVAHRRALAEAPDEIASLARQLRPDAMEFPVATSWAS